MMTLRSIWHHAIGREEPTEGECCHKKFRKAQEDNMAELRRLQTGLERQMDVVEEIAHDLRPR